MNYSLDAGAWNSVFAVPSSVVDKYIKLADGASLKLLLYLLRHGGEQFTEEQLRDALNIKRGGELEDAAMFWFQRGIIRMDDGELTPTDDSVQERLSEAGEPEPEKMQTSSLRKVAVNNGSAIYTAGDIARLEQSTVSYGDFFLNAPVLKPNRTIQHPVNGGGAPLRFSGDRLDAVRFQILFIFRTPFPWM